MIRSLKRIPGGRSASFSFRANTTSSILIEKSSKHEGVTHLVLNRHEGKNSFSKVMVEEFNNALLELKNDPSINCLILKSSVPKVFCAGADLKERLVMPAEEVQIAIKLTL